MSTQYRGWYRLSLGDPLLADVLRDELMQVVSTSNVELYSRHEGEGQLHCELVVYFKGGVDDIARTGIAQTYGAIPCSDPGRGLLRLTN
ncbi:MAG TPA: hypothetical protein DIW43_04735 [Spongiibacteraceae bacterium]|nr:hypothetical protein [Spongiibacteraceae bacterium]HCS26732.1 hypothetical protein [Spongiibacteraceae bacterium]|tara:strand:+ start:2778 stop:3044 length:267 start_codon:yes stop_codon:yes gene_type:complete